MEGLRARIDAEMSQEVAESDFVLKIRSLVEFGLDWNYIYNMQDHAKPEFKDIWCRWVEVAHYIIEGRV